MTLSEEVIKNMPPWMIKLASSSGLGAMCGYFKKSIPVPFEFKGRLQNVKTNLALI